MINIVKVIKNLSSKVKILLSVGSVSTAGLTTCAWVFIAQAVAHKSKTYQFQNKLFNSYDDVVKYANANLKVKNQIEGNEMVVYNNVAYGQNLEEMFKLIDDDYKIEKVKTYKNPEDYIVLNNNQLSNVAITDVHEKPVRVYKGKNGNAYLNKEEAISTYMQYEKSYLVGNVSFDNLETAKNAVKKEIGSKFETEGSVIGTTKVYNIDGIEQTEEQLKQSIAQDVTLKYEWNGIPLDITDPEFDQADFSDLEQQHTTPINSSKAGYWIDFPETLKGRFVGPQFVQTYSDIESIFYTNWKKVDSTSINLAMLNTVLVGEIVSMFTSLKLNKSKEWNLKQTFFKDDEALFKEYKDFLKDNNYTSLNELEFSHQEAINSSQQIPMFFKNLIFAKKWYDQFYFQHKDEGLYKKIDQIFKKAVSKWLDISILELDWDEIINDETIEMLSIIDYFLNPQKTVQDTNSTQGFYKKMVVSSQSFLTIMMEEGTSNKEKNGKKSKMATNMVQLTKNKENEEEVYYDESQNIIPKNEYYDLIFNVFNGTLEVLGPLASKLGSLVKKIPIIGNVIDLIWDVADLLSPIEYVTYKLELEEGQSIFYYTTEYKIPFLNLKLTQDNPEFETSKQLLYHSKLSEGVMFKGNFYSESEKKQVTQDFKSWVANNPEEIATKTFFVYKPNNLTKEIRKNENSDYTKECFVEEIFNLKKTNSSQKYSDGFGEYFENQDSAKTSYIRKQADSSNFKFQYKYTDFKGQNHFFDQEPEVKEYIKNYINRQIESKLVLSTDLIVTIDYEELKKIHDYQYEVYQVLIGTKEYLFLTHLDAKAFVYKNVNLEYHKKNITNGSYIFNDSSQFNSKIDFNKWLASQIKIIN